MSHTCHEYTQTDSSEHPHQSYHWQNNTISQRSLEPPTQAFLEKLVFHPSPQTPAQPKAAFLSHA